MLTEAIQLDHEVAECEIRIITNETSEIFGTRGFGIDKYSRSLGGFQMADVFGVGEECNLVRSGYIDRCAACDLNRSVTFDSCSDSICELLQGICHAGLP